MTTATRRRPRQRQFKNMEDKRNPKLERLAGEYVDRRMALGEEEVAKHDLLLAAMAEAGLTTHRFDGLIVTVTKLEKVKVKRKDTDD